jgi:glucokinase
MTLLAGDLGGTKTLLALCDDRGVPLHTQRMASHTYGGLAEMVEAFLADPAVRDQPRPTHGAFGVAGPIEEDPLRPLAQRARITNLSFVIETAELLARSGLVRARLYNDFYTAAAAISVLASPDGKSHAAAADLVALNPGAQADPHAAVAVLGAGTGLGEALIAREAGCQIITPTEGGHTDLAARDAVELDLLRFLMARHPEHVSVERVLSGAGIATLYEFFAARGEVPENPQVRAAVAAAGSDAPAIISQHALRGDDAVCALALRRFVMLYGAEAGNLALKSLAKGGVYLAGGIAAKILPLMTDGTFLQSFVRKGRFTALLQQIPIYVVQNPEIGLLGAAHLATQL